MTDFRQGRHAGVSLPLSAATSTMSWGIGEIGDLPWLCAWLDAAGLDLLQLLPVNEMAGGDHSPYSAIAAMAIDPIYVSLRDVDDHVALGGETGLPAEDRRALAELRRAPRVEFLAVRALKERALRAAFDRFVEAEWRRGSERARRLGAFIEAERWWLDDYALFRAERARHGQAAWWTWEAPLARRDPAALAEARAAHASEILFHTYAQWIAGTQWRAARDGAEPVGLVGDLPFMVGRDSADVWARQHAFAFDATIGVPPDAFSETGQDWSLPPYRWDVFAREDDQWIRERARRTADLFAGFRLDHVVGYYRTYVIPVDGSAHHFVPAAEPDQIAQGERLLKIFAAAGAAVVAEDLGTVPDFVRASLARLGLPGYRVLRWERDWDAPGQPFRDPRHWPAISVATSGTHDTEPLSEWWEAAPAGERSAALRLSASREAGAAPAAYTPAVRDALLELLFASRSNLLILPMPDLFGWRDRINVPGTVGEQNWTYRLRWPVDRLADLPEARERARALRAWAQRHGRAG